MTVDFRKEQEDALFGSTTGSFAEQLTSFRKLIQKEAPGRGLGTTYTYLAVKTHGDTVSSASAEGTTVTVICDRAGKSEKNKGAKCTFL